MKEFYIKDENGKYISADGQCRFSKLKGRALYAYLNSAEGKTKRFLIEKDDRGVEIGVEVTDPKIIEETDTVSGHEYYLRKLYPSMRQLQLTVRNYPAKKPFPIRMPISKQKLCIRWIFKHCTEPWNCYHPPRWKYCTLYISVKTRYLNELMQGCLEYRT